MTIPAVSVLMPVFNRERFVADAIHSVLRQTFRDFELVVVDDGSVDHTPHIVRAISDPRIRLVEHRSNQGIPFARNTALREARGKFIAWLDSDDVARPQRLERQVRFLQRHPRTAMIGSFAGRMDTSGRPLPGVRVHPLDHEEIRCWLLFRSAFQQSSILGRSEVLQAHPYRPDFDVCEDIDVDVRIAESHGVANLPEVLVDRRMHEGQIGRQARQRILDAQAKISRPQLDKLGVAYSEADLERHCQLARAARTRPSDAELEWAEQWLERLCSANRQMHVFDQRALALVAGFLLFNRCRRQSPRRAVDALFSSRIGRGAFCRRALSWMASAAPAIVGARLSQERRRG